MKIYKDKQLQVEVQELDLGILEAGESKIYTFYVYNDTEAELTVLAFAVPHKEVAIIEAPKNMLKLSSAELTIKWSPSITLREGLKTSLQISGTELWG
jgi:hypothetical protein